jgi:hypothetical protein
MLTSPFGNAGRPLHDELSCLDPYVVHPERENDGRTNQNPILGVVEPFAPTIMDDPPSSLIAAEEIEFLLDSALSLQGKRHQTYLRIMLN